MKDLIWDKSLSVQVDEIDNDHRMLVELFNILNHSIEDGESVEYIEAVVEELICGTVWHFRHEERLMLKYGYAGLAEHRAEHEELVVSAKRLQRDLLLKHSVSVEDIKFLEHWLTGHILTSDMEMAAFLCKVM